MGDGTEPGTPAPDNPHDVQDTLFDDRDLRPLPEDIGYRGPIACSAADITYRQLDYWARTGLVEPSIRTASGSGSQRLYSFRDILVLRIVKRLIDTGVSLPNIRAAVNHVRHGRVAQQLLLRGQQPGRPSSTSTTGGTPIWRRSPS